MTLHTFGTRLVSVSVHRRDEGYLWVREPGPAHRPGPPVPNGLREQVAARHPALRVPVEEDGGFRYTAAGPVPAAMVLAMDKHSAMLPAALHTTGAALAALHELPAPPEVTAPHTGPERWRRGSADPDTPAGRLRAAAYARLGKARWDRLDRALRALPPGDSLLHGNASLAMIVPQSRGRTVLLTGETFARGPWWLDLGWLIAELHEVEAAADAGIAPGHDRDYAALRAAAVAGYGREPDPGLIDVLTVARVLTHARDYAAYVGWHDQLLTYLDISAGLIDRRL